MARTIRIDKLQRVLQAVGIDLQAALATLEQQNAQAIEKAQERIGYSRESIETARQEYLATVERETAAMNNDYKIITAAQELAKDAKALNVIY